MNARQTQVLEEALSEIPNIEEPHLTQTHHEILAYLGQQNHPRLAKTISARLGIPYHSVRARLHELSKLGLVYQPKKGISMSDLDQSGIINNFPNQKKCGYLIKK